MSRADYAVAWAVVLIVVCTLAAAVYAGGAAAIEGLEDERSCSGLAR